MRRCLIAGLLSVAALLPAVPAAAQSKGEGAAMPASADLLEPGQFVWYPHYQKASSAGTVSIVVSIPQQLLFAYQDGKLIAVSTVSTGAAGNDTPTGQFTILQKKTFHRSSLYANAPMPYMQRLTWDGIALHAGQLPGYPASHGCIRLPKEFARELYEITQMGASVSVVDEFIDTAPALPIPASAPSVASPLGDDMAARVATSAEVPSAQPASWVAGPAREASGTNN